VVERCLRADPAERWQGASDVKEELEWTSKTISLTPAATRQRPRWVWLLAVAAVIAASLIVLVLVVQRPTLPQTPASLSLTFEGLFAEGVAPLRSPDGTMFVFHASDASGNPSLWIRPLNSQT